MDKTKANALPCRIGLLVTEAEYAYIRKMSIKNGCSMSEVVRECLNLYTDPEFAREYLALIKRIRADLSYCQQRIKKKCSEETIASMEPIFQAAKEALCTLEEEEVLYGYGSEHHDPAEEK